MPVRRDYYVQDAWKSLQTDPDEQPFSQKNPLVYRDTWTGRYFREMALIIRIMCQDTHGELKQAWRAILAAPEDRRAAALAALQEMSAVSYDRTLGDIRARLGSKNKVEEVRLAKELADFFRANYTKAEAIAQGRE